MRFAPRPALLAATLAAFASVTLFAACDSATDMPPDEPPPGPAFEREVMLTQWADAVIRPAYQALDAEVSDLVTAGEAFADAPSEATLGAAQTALRDARMAWQDANLFGFGPADNLALRGTLNTFPTDASRIEANVASGTYVIGAVVNADAVGFPALDYLLHGASDAEILAAFAQDSRKDYLRDNLSFIQTAVSQTASNWENGYQENFLSASNAGTDTGSSLGMVINAMTLHYERFLRDGKIGIPAGVRSAGVPRPTLVESVYGGYSVDLAVANLEAFKRLFLGNTLAGAEGVGLDDNLEALDAAPLAESIVAEIDEAIAAVQNLTDPLDQQIQADNQLAITAFQQMQDVVALVKSDMTSVLGVTITFRDIDGD